MEKSVEDIKEKSSQIPMYLTDATYKSVCNLKQMKLYSFNKQK
jgi:replication-associated recombination protein RarA